MLMIEDTPTLSADLPDIVNALAASPNGVCFAARNSGLYRSDDGGQRWCSAYDSLKIDAPLATTAVAISPDFADDRTIIAGVNGGFLRSADGGATWTVITLPLPAPLVTTLALSPDFECDGVVIGGTLEDGIFRSSDRGSSWSPWNFGLLDLQVLALAFSPNFAADETLFAGTTSGVFRSTNGGRAWRETPFPTECAPVLSIAVSPSYAHDGVVFVGTESNGLMSSDDRGQTWLRRGEAVITDAVNGVVFAPQFPVNPKIMVLLNDALLVSHDGGTGWAQYSDDVDFGLGAASVSVPQGAGPAAPLLIGLLDGSVLRFPID